MSVRVIAVVLVLGIGILAYVGWKKNADPPTSAAPQAQDSSGEASTPGMPPAASGDPGLAWTAPPGWQPQPERPVRLATYKIPRAKGDAEDAECAVFYFGPGQGGGVEANIERWVAEFENATPPRRSDAAVGGFKLSRVEVSGTYTAHGGSNMEAQGPRSDWKLVGAIVEGAAGPVFFKFTGPVGTVDAARKGFDAMLGSIRRK